MPIILIQIKVLSSSSEFIVINEQINELKLTATAPYIYRKSVRLYYPHSYRNGFQVNKTETELKNQAGFFTLPHFILLALIYNCCYQCLSSFKFV